MKLKLHENDIEIEFESQRKVICYSCAGFLLSRLQHFKSGCLFQVYKIDAEGNVSEIPVGNTVAHIKHCDFAQTTVRHLDAVVNIVTKTEPEKSYNCNNCNKTFGGPKRLERHTCDTLVKSESQLLFTNDASSPIILDSDNDEDEPMDARKHTMEQC